MCYNTLMEMMENREAVYHITTATATAAENDCCQ
jgi:hypothetical protein